MDVLDERVGTYRCKRKVNRWPMAIFENLLDVSVFNAFVIFTELNPQWKEKEKKYRRRLFIIDVAEDLVMDYIHVRKNAPRSENANSVVQMIRGVIRCQTAWNIAKITTSEETSPLPRL